MTKWERIRREIAKRLASKWGWGAIACGATAGIVAVVSLTDDRVSLREPKPLGSFIFDDRSPGERIGPVSLSKGLRYIHRVTREWTPEPAPPIGKPDYGPFNETPFHFDNMPGLPGWPSPPTPVVIAPQEPEFAVLRSPPHFPGFWVGAGDRPTPTLTPPPPGTPTQFSSSVPEISSWLMLLIGFGSIGFGMRRRYKVA